MKAQANGKNNMFREVSIQFLIKYGQINNQRHIGAGYSDYLSLTLPTSQGSLAGWYTVCGTGPFVQSTHHVRPVLQFCRDSAQ